MHGRHCPDGACAEENPYSTRLRIQTFGVAFSKSEYNNVYSDVLYACFGLLKS